MCGGVRVGVCTLVVGRTSAAHGFGGGMVGLGCRYRRGVRLGGWFHINV